MGWTYQHRQTGISNKEFFAGLFDHDNGKVLDVASHLRTSYIAYQVPDGVTALVILTHWVPNDSYHNFGYKDQDEGMGPCETACPARILDMLSPVEQLYSGNSAEWASTWRQACRDRLAERAAKPRLSKGCVVQFAAPIEFTNGDSLDTFQYMGKNRFARTGGYGGYRISGWKDRDYAVIAR